MHAYNAMPVIFSDTLGVLILNAHNFIPVLAIALATLFASVADTPIARAAQPVPQPQVQSLAAPSLQQQVWTLQQQVAALQSQLNAVLAAVQVTTAGVTLQGPSVTITGGTIEVKAQNTLRVGSIAADMIVNVGQGLSLDVRGNTLFRSAGTLRIESGGELDLRGATVRLNRGTNPVPLATVGSQVQVMVGGQAVIGQIVSGSPTLFAN